MNDFHWVWQTVLIFYIGRFILRIGGRKSISQMTITQVIVMVGIGSLLIQPVSGKGLLITFGVALLITVLMIITEYLEMKFDFMETISTGKAVLVIDNGEVQIENLKKVRLTIDRLETRLRQSGVSSIEDVQYATIEVSGQLGYELKDSKKPLTKEDFFTFMNEATAESRVKNRSVKKRTNNNLFEEIKTNKFEGKNEP
ncbi:DUF421 domain-containing protein [Virgibacillus sp. W0430]|uniref:DUF421 domain-containing protein n=1 Tax=Virgibacillus sp. W0430 TaxID=3391580 RepID=UPI003F45316B